MTTHQQIDFDSDAATNAWVSAYWFACGWTMAQNDSLPEHSSEFADRARRLRAEHDAGLTTHLPSIPDMHTAFMAGRNQR